jgi:hypothetical protein
VWHTAGQIEIASKILVIDPIGAVLRISQYVSAIQMLTDRLHWWRWSRVISSSRWRLIG